MRPGFGHPDGFLLEQCFMETAANFGRQFATTEIVTGVCGFDTDLRRLFAQPSAARYIEGL